MPNVLLYSILFHFSFKVFEKRNSNVYVLKNAFNEELLWYQGSKNVKVTGYFIYMLARYLSHSFIKYLPIKFETQMFNENYVRINLWVIVLMVLK